MFRKEVTPRMAAIALVLILAVVQLVYWRLLVYRPPGVAPGGGGGGPMPGAQPFLAGLEQVQVETLTGGDPGFLDGPGWQARFCGPNALALDKDGSLLVADSRNHRIRRVQTSGRVSTIAGGGPAEGSGGRGEGDALNVGLAYPSGVAATADGRIVIADTGNHRLCVLHDGRLEHWIGSAAGFADGTARTAQLKSPSTLTATSDGAVWMLDDGGKKVRKVDAGGVVTTPPTPPAPVLAALGWAAGTSGETIGGWGEAWNAPGPSPLRVGRLAAGAALPGKPMIVPDARQNVVLARSENRMPLLIAGYLTPSGGRYESRDGGGHKASFAAPCAAVMAADGLVYLADYEGNRIRTLRLPPWLLEGQFTAPEPRGRWRTRRGN